MFGHIHTGLKRTACNKSLEIWYCSYHYNAAVYYANSLVEDVTLILEL